MHNKFTDIKIAIVYDKVTTRYGGAEWVLQGLQKAFPNAPLVTSIYTPKKTPWAGGFTVITSFLQHLPVPKNHKLLTPLLPLAFESLDFSSFDVVISVTSGEAKGILTKPDQLHICYLLTPTRFLYSHTQTYLKSKKLLQLPGVRLLVRIFLSYLRWWDQAASTRPDKYVVISKRIADRLERYYHRKPDKILYPPLPPVATSLSYKIPTLPSSYLISLSRLVVYKRVDLSISAALATGKTLVVVGEGEEKQTLIALAGRMGCLRRSNESLTAFFNRAHKNQARILFTSQVTNAERLVLLSRADALLMPGIEDFGITGLEATTLGVPVIVHHKSGVAEVLGKLPTCLHTKSMDTQAVITALAQLPTVGIPENTLSAFRKNHSIDHFASQFKKYLYDTIIQFKTE